MHSTSIPLDDPYSPQIFGLEDDMDDEEDEDEDKEDEAESDEPILYS